MATTDNHLLTGNVIGFSTVLSGLGHDRPATPMLPPLPQDVARNASPDTESSEQPKLTELQGTDRCLACRSTNTTCMVNASAKSRAKQPSCERCRGRQRACLFDNTLNDVLDVPAHDQLYNCIADTINRDMTSRQWIEDVEEISVEWKGETGQASRDRVAELVREIRETSLQASKSMRLFSLGNPVLQQEVSMVLDKREEAAG